MDVSALVDKGGAVRPAPLALQQQGGSSERTSAAQQLPDRTSRFGSPSAAAAARQQSQPVSPPHLLNMVAHTHDMLYSGRSDVWSDGRSLAEQRAAMDLTLRTTTNEIHDMAAQLAEQDQRSGMLAAKRAALMAELAVLHKELDAPPPPEFAAASAAATLEAAQQRVSSSLLPVRTAARSSGTTSSQRAPGGSSNGGVGGSSAGGVGGAKDNSRGSTAPAQQAHGSLSGTAGFLSGRLTGGPGGTAGGTTGSSKLAPLKDPPPLRASTAPASLKAHPRWVAVPPAQESSLSGTGGTSGTTGGTTSRSSSGDPAPPPGSAAHRAQRESETAEALRLQYLDAMNQLMSDAKESRVRLQQQIASLGAASSSHRAQYNQLTAAHAAAQARLKVVTKQHVQIQSTKLDLLSRDGSNGSCAKTRAIIESASRDAVRQGRQVTSGITSLGAVSAARSTPGTGHSTTTGAILRNSVQGEQALQSDDSKLYMDVEHELSLLEVLPEVKRLLRLQELSSRFNRAGVTTQHLAAIMNASTDVFRLDDVGESVEALVRLAKSLLGAQRLNVYRCKSGKMWCVGPACDMTVPHPVGRGVAAYVVQSAATLHTSALRKSHVYDHDSEDVQVPVTPHTPALAMAVRDPECPQYPVGGQLPGKLVIKAVGKDTTTPVGPSGFTTRDVSMMKVVGSMFDHLLGNWDVISKIQVLNQRLDKLSASLQSVLQQQDTLKQLFCLADVAADVLHSQAAVLYVIDRQHNELVGYCSGPERKRIRRNMVGALGQVFSSARVLNLAEAGHDKTYSNINDSPPGCNVRNALLAPVAAVGSINKLMGLIQVVNKRHEEGSILNPREVQHPTYDTEDEDTLRAIAAAVTSACTTCGNLNAVLDKQAGNDPIYACRTVHDVCRKLCSAVKDSLQCEGARVFFVKHDQNMLQVTPTANDEQCYPLDAGIVGRAAVTGRVQNFSSTYYARPAVDEPPTSRQRSTALDESAGWDDSLLAVPSSPHFNRGAGGSKAQTDWDFVSDDVYDVNVDGAGPFPSSLLAVPLFEPGATRPYAILAPVNKRHGSFQAADLAAVRAAVGRAGLALLSATAHEAVEAANSYMEAARTYLVKLCMEAKDFRRMGVMVEDACQTLTGSDMCVLALTPGFDAAPRPNTSAANANTTTANITTTSIDASDTVETPTNANDTTTSDTVDGVTADATTTDVDTTAATAAPLKLPQQQQQPSRQDAAAGGTQSAAAAEPLVCPAGAMSDGWDHPDVMERAAGVVASGEVLEEACGNAQARDEYNGRLVPLVHRYYIPVRSDVSGEVLGALGVERSGYKAYGAKEKHLLDLVAHRIVMLIRFGKLRPVSTSPTRFSLTSTDAAGLAMEAGQEGQVEQEAGQEGQQDDVVVYTA